jgi:hypothetical protein
MASSKIEDLDENGDLNNRGINLFDDLETFLMDFDEDIVGGIGSIDTIDDRKPLTNSITTEIKSIN